jgi:hypothetical protein
VIRALPSSADGVDRPDQVPRVGVVGHGGATMTHDWNDPDRPLFANMDDDEERSTKRETDESFAPGGIEPLTMAQPGSGAIPLGTPRRIDEPTEPGEGEDGTDPRAT